jgi:hypothetical protein
MEQNDLSRSEIVRNNLKQSVTAQNNPKCPEKRPELACYNLEMLKRAQNGLKQLVTAGNDPKWSETARNSPKLSNMDHSGLKQPNNKSKENKTTSSLKPSQK